MDDVKLPNSNPDANVGVSPRGYAYRLPETPLPKTNPIFDTAGVGDSTIEHLWAEHCNKPKSDILPRSLAMTARMGQLIGDFKSWLYLNLRYNQSLYGYNLDFLKDCIVFSQTGERKFSINTWYDLVQEVPSAERKDLSQRPAIMEDIFIPDLEDLLTDWLAQPNGYEDLMYSAFIMFGKVQAKI